MDLFMVYRAILRPFCNSIIAEMIELHIIETFHPKHPDLLLEKYTACFSFQWFQEKDHTVYKFPEWTGLIKRVVVVIVIPQTWCYQQFLVLGKDVIWFNRMANISF